MDYLLVHTTRGILPMVGQIHTDPARPALLIVGGAFPPRDYMHDMVDALPEASVLVGGLPSMVGPPFEDGRAEALSAAFDEVVASLLPGRPVVTYGVSTGCLVTLGMRSPQIRRQVAQEPFFRTATLWPFIADAHDRLRAFPESDVMAAFLFTLFGITAAGVEDRDYSPLVEGLQVPTDVIVGELALEPQRPLPPWPSFTSADDRRRLAANPMATVHVGPPGSGHHVVATEAGEALVMQVLRAALAEAAVTR